MRVDFSDEVKQTCENRLQEAMNSLQAAQSKLQTTLEQELRRTEYLYINKKTCETISYLERCAKAVAAGRADLPMEVFAKSCELHESAQDGIKKWCARLRSQICEKQCSFDVQSLNGISTTSTNIQDTDFDLIVSAFQTYVKELQELSSQWTAKWKNETDNALTEHFGTYMSNTCFLPEAKAAEKGSTFIKACRDYFVQTLNNATNSSGSNANSAGTDPENSGNAGNGSSSAVNSQGSAEPAQDQALGHPAIGLDWNMITGFAKRMKQSSDLDEKFSCFFDLYHAIYQQTTPFSVQLSNIEEASSTEMSRLVEATKYALEHLGDQFVRLIDGSRAKWWNESWIDAVVSAASRFNQAHSLFTAENGRGTIEAAADAASSEQERAEATVNAGKYRPATIVASIKQYNSLPADTHSTIEDCLKSSSPLPWNEWNQYKYYAPLLDSAKDKETLGMALHIVSFILHDNVRYIQFGAHTTSLWKFWKYFGHGNEADQHIAYQYGPAMSALNKFANCLLDIQNSSVEEQFYQRFDAGDAATKLGHGPKNAVLNEKNMKSLMQLDPDPDLTHGTGVMAKELYCIIQKYRFAIDNEKTRDELNLQQFDMGVDIATDAINSLTTVFHAGGKLIPGGEDLLKVALGPMENLVALSSHILKGDIVSLASDIADKISEIEEASNTALIAIQRLLEIYEYAETGKNVGVGTKDAVHMIGLVSSEELTKICGEIDESLNKFNEYLKEKRENTAASRSQKKRQKRLNEIRASMIANPNNSPWNDAIRVAFIELEGIENPKEEQSKFDPKELCYIPKRYWNKFDQIAAAYLASIRWKTANAQAEPWQQERQAEEALRDLLGIERSQRCAESQALECIFRRS